MPQVSDGQVYTFIKRNISEDNMEEMVEKLSHFKMSLPAYQRAMQFEEIAILTS